MFYERFVNLCTSRGVKPSVVAKDIGLSNAAPTYWKNGSVPKAGTMQALADYFSVSVDYFLTLETDAFGNPMANIPRPVSDEELIHALWGDSDGVTPDMLEEVRIYADFLKYRKSRNHK